jgi:hypothetical protein
MHWPPLPPGNIPGTHFCKRLSQPQGHSAARRIMSMKNSNDTIRNRTRNLPTCSAVPQPTALPRAPPITVQFLTSTLYQRHRLGCYNGMYKSTQHFILKDSILCCHTHKDLKCHVTNIALTKLHQNIYWLNACTNNMCTPFILLLSAP